MGGALPQPCKPDAVQAPEQVDASPSNASLPTSPAAKATPGSPTATANAAAGGDAAKTSQTAKLVRGIAQAKDLMRPNIEQEREEPDGQLHVWTFREELEREARQELEADMDGLDDGIIEECFQQASELKAVVDFESHMYEAPRKLNWHLKTAPKLESGINVTRLSEVKPATIEEWRRRGLDLLQEGLVGFVILAGGDGSRLVGGDPKACFGYSPPVPCLNLGLLSHKPIFQLYCERVQRVQSIVARRYVQLIDRTIAEDLKTARRRGWVNTAGQTMYPKILVHPVPVYVMCSIDNVQEIKTFFKDHNYFGLKDQDVLFVIQEDWPVLSKTGKILMQNKSKLIKRPNGTGGMFRALLSDGALMDMKARGLSAVYISSSNNILARVCDPIFLGYCTALRLKVGLKCVERVTIDERLGVLTTKKEEFTKDDDNDGDLDLVERFRPCILEFFELNPRMLRAKGADPASFKFYAGNLSQYFMLLEVVNEINESDEWPQWHAIDTWMPYFAPHLKRNIKPPQDECNALRIESLITDAFYRYDKAIALQVEREHELALVRSLSDSIAAVAAMSLLHQRWITGSGGVFDSDMRASIGHDNRCEISPLVSYSGEGLDGIFTKKGTVQRSLCLPLHIAAAVESSPEGGDDAGRGKWPLGRFFPTFPDGIVTVYVERDVGHIRFVPWESASADWDVLDMGLSPVPALIKLDKAIAEQARSDEKLPDTPKWLRDMAKSSEVLQRKAVEDKQDELKKDAKRSPNDRQVGGSPPQARTNRNRDRTLPRRPEKDEADEDLVYNMVPKWWNRYSTEDVWNTAHSTEVVRVEAKDPLTSEPTTPVPGKKSKKKKHDDTPATPTGGKNRRNSRN